MERMISIGLKEMRNSARVVERASKPLVRRLPVVEVLAGRPGESKASKLRSMAVHRIFNAIDEHREEKAREENDEQH